VKRTFALVKVIHFVLAGSLLLAGCPGTGDVGVAGLTVRGAPGEPGTCEKPSNADALTARVLDLVNIERQSRGLHPLTLNPILSEMADDYCCEMIECGFFSHQNPDEERGPGQRAINHGYVFLAIGENLACGQALPDQVVADWMSSTEGHRENILAHQWREIGIAVRTGGEYGVYWVQEFGNPP